MEQINAELDRSNQRVVALGVLAIAACVALVLTYAVVLELI